MEGNGNPEKDNNVKTDNDNQINFKPLSSSSPKVKKDKQEIRKVKDDIFKCSMCDYQSKKEATLKEHIKINHEDYVCKECNEKLSSFMKLLNHIAKNHPKETVEEKEIKDSGEKDAENKDVEKD